MAKSTAAALRYETLENALIEEKVADDLPKNTLEIPKDRWSEKMPALAQRVLRYFYDQGIARKEPSQDSKKKYQAFLKAWGKPWRVHYLTINFDKEELQLIWDQLLLVQANTPEELEKQKQLVEATLKKVQPSPELPQTTNISDHYSTQQDVDLAVREKKLVEVKTNNMRTSQKEYVLWPLAQVISADLDPKIVNYKDVLEISSATRFLKLQTLLKEKLGYLASKISYHTKGAAIDLKLSDNAKKHFDDYMQEKVNEKTPRLDRLTLLYKQGTPLTVSNLVKQGVLDPNQELAQVFKITEEAVSGKGVEIIDETFFGVRIDKDGNVTEINPVFHLQYPQ